MDRKVVKISHDRDAMEFRMASAVERDAWMRTFPPDIADTHRLEYRWEQRPDGDTLVCKVVLKDEAAAQAKAKADQVPAGVTELRLEFEKLSDADLETRAVEMGITDAKGRRRPQLIAQMAKKELERRAAAQAG